MSQKDRITHFLIINKATFKEMPAKFMIQCHAGSKAEKLAKDYCVQYETISE